MELLFARLPEELKLHAIKQTARFVTTSTLASVTNEASLICNAAAWAAPKACTELLLKPLLNRIEEETRHDGTTGTGRMSKVLHRTVVLNIQCHVGMLIFSESQHPKHAQKLLNRKEETWHDGANGTWLMFKVALYLIQIQGNFLHTCMCLYMGTRLCKCSINIAILHIAVLHMYKCSFTLMCNITILQDVKTMMPNVQHHLGKYSSLCCSQGQRWTACAAACKCIVTFEKGSCVPKYSV